MRRVSGVERGGKTGWDAGGRLQRGKGLGVGRSI